MPLPATRACGDALLSAGENSWSLSLRAGCRGAGGPGPGRSWGRQVQPPSQEFGARPQVSEGPVFCLLQPQHVVEESHWAEDLHLLPALGVQAGVGGGALPGPLNCCVTLGRLLYSPHLKEVVPLYMPSKHALANT